MASTEKSVKLTKAQRQFVRSNPDAARLLSHTDIGDDCWEWHGAADKRGYGFMAFRGKTWKAHRVSYTIFCGEIPDGLLVCHHCDNPCCVNPSHLFLGHQTTNMRDMVRKGRAKNFITSRQDHYKNGPPSGENASSAKLTAVQVREIISAAAHGALSKDLSQRYGISRFTIQAILRGQTWRDLPRPPGLPRKTGRYERGRLALAQSEGE